MHKFNDSYKHQRKMKHYYSYKELRKLKCAIPITYWGGCHFCVEIHVAFQLIHLGPAGSQRCQLASHQHPGDYQSQLLSIAASPLENYEASSPCLDRRKRISLHVREPDQAVPVSSVGHKR